MNKSQQPAIGIFAKRNQNPQQELPTIKSRKSVIIKDLRQLQTEPIHEPAIRVNQPKAPPTFGDSPFTKHFPTMSLAKEIEQINSSEDLLLREYYNKRHILINALKNSGKDPLAEGAPRTPPKPPQPQQTPQPLLTAFVNQAKSNQEAASSSKAVIPIFAGYAAQKGHTAPTNEISQKQNVLSSNMSFRTKTEESRNESYRGIPNNSEQQLQESCEHLVIPRLRIPQSQFASQSRTTTDPYFPGSQKTSHIELQKTSQQLHQQLNQGEKKTANPQQAGLQHFRYSKRTSLQMKIPPEYLEENNWANEQYEMDVGEEKEEEEYDDSTTESFYAAYLRVQEEKLQKQQFEVHRLVEKVKEESETDRTLIANLSLNTLKRTEPEELEFYEASVLDAESKSDADDWEVPEVKFAFLLAEAISLEEHRNILKEQLRYKVYEIFRLFSFSGADLTGQQFTATLEVIMKETNYRQADFQRLAKIFFVGKNKINRKTFTHLFTGNTPTTTQNLLEDDATSMRSYHSRKQNTSECLKGFFSDWIEVGYFEDKMRVLATSRGSTGVSNLFNEISQEKDFSEMDIFYFLMDKVKAKVEPSSVGLLFDRLLLRQRNGRFSKNDFYSWLRNR